jgi:serine/threonine protein kinase
LLCFPSQGYSYPSDIWSIGVTILEVAAGKYPYKSRGPFDLFDEICSDTPPVDCLPPGKFSENFIDFIRQMLRRVGCCCSPCSGRSASFKCPNMHSFLRVSSRAMCSLLCAEPERAPHRFAAAGPPLYCRVCGRRFVPSVFRCTICSPFLPELIHACGTPCRAPVVGSESMQDASSTLSRVQAEQFSSGWRSSVDLQKKQEQLLLGIVDDVV